MNELFRFEKIFIFSEKKTFALLFTFLFVDFEFSFPPLKCFIYFKHRNFHSGIVAKVYAGKKLILLHSRKFFHICRVSTFKVYAEGKSFTDYILTIVAEIYIIFRSELTRQMSNRPYSLVTDWSNDEAVIKNWILFRFVCLVIRKEKPLFTS